MYDDFMQYETPLGVERVPSRLAASPHVPCTAIEQRGVSSVTNLAHGIHSDTFLVAKSNRFYHRILRLRDWAQVSLLDARVQELGCLGRRHESPQGARGLARHPGHPLYKIIIHNVSDDPGAIIGAHEVFAPH